MVDLLKSCPRCSVRAGVVTGYKVDALDKKLYSVACSQAGHVACFVTPMFATEDLASDCWNRRFTTASDGRCLFCGGELMMEEVKNELLSRFFPWIIKCSSCGIHSPAGRSHKEIKDKYGLK